MQATDRCLITNRQIKDFKEGKYDSKNYFEYSVNIAGLGIRVFRFCINCLTNIKKVLEKEKEIVYSHLMNGKEFDLDEYRNGNIIHTSTIENFLKENEYPKSINDKKENLFLYLLGKQDYEGQIIDLKTFLIKEDQWRKLYFKTYGECDFYLKVLLEEKLIDARYENQIMKTGRLNDCNITYTGLSYANTVKEEGLLSNKCFVAMRFSEQTKAIREAIREAINETGFTAIFIDEVQHENESTINDGMIARMKESKFCIADFTEQNRGVYFESGYMMGRGRKVIFTCKKDYFDDITSLDKKSHFDVNHFSHIIYNSPAELKAALIDGIRSRILI